MARRPKVTITPQTVAAAPVPHDPDDPFAGNDLPPEAGEPTDGAPPNEEEQPDDAPDDDGEPMLFLQPARLGALKLTDQDVEVDGVIEFAWCKGATSSTTQTKVAIRRKLEREEEADVLDTQIPGSGRVWREGTPSEAHQPLSNIHAQMRAGETEYSWTVYLVGSTGVLPEAPRVEASAPIKSGTVSANKGCVTLTLSVDFGPLPRKVLDAVEVLDGRRVLLVGRAAQGDMFSGD